MDRKLLKYGVQSRRRVEARKWIQGQDITISWEVALHQVGGDVGKAERFAEALMLGHWADRTYGEDLRLFRVRNTAGSMMLVIAESERQARAITLRENHILEYDNGDCEEVRDCATHWGAGFSSAVERAKAQGFSGRIERKGNHAVMGDKIYSPLTAV